MSRSRLIRGTAIVLLLGLTVVSSAGDTAAVNLLEAQGYIDHYAMYPAGSHGPCAGAAWLHEPEDGVYFDWQGTHDYGCLDSSWATRCDAEGLLFTGHWHPSFDGDLLWGPYLEAQITVLFELTAATRLTAVRDTPCLRTVRASQACS